MFSGSMMPRGTISLSARHLRPLALPSASRYQRLPRSAFFASTNLRPSFLTWVARRGGERATSFLSPFAGHEMPFRSLSMQVQTNQSTSRKPSRAAAKVQPMICRSFFLWSSRPSSAAAANPSIERKAYGLRSCQTLGRKRIPSRNVAPTHDN